MTRTRPVLSLGCALLSFFILWASAASASQLTNWKQAEEFKRIEELKLIVDELSLNRTNFYNYSLLCGGKEFTARVHSTASIDASIPAEFWPQIRQSYTDPSDRANKCPNWVTNANTQGIGAMEKLTIEETTPIGTKVYSLLASDPELQPIFYFIRLVETEPAANKSNIFRIEHRKEGHNWIGDVYLNVHIDYETKRSYQYLTYAYDGVNLIERFTNVQIADLDDERPRILTSTNLNFSNVTARFEYSIYENISIGTVINVDSLIQFFDVDTQRSQLRISLISGDNDDASNAVFSDLPFSVNNDGEIKLITNLDFEIKKNYLFKLRVVVRNFLKINSAF